MAKRPILFGDIQGIEEGHQFNNRKEMMPSSFHRVWTKGIDGNPVDGASAIVLSGGYEDDQDLGDVIIYTGAGGNDQNSKRQIEDQSWSHSDNSALIKSMNNGLPVRVVRGSKHKSPYSPTTGYTYAGLYSVIDAWEEKGNSGFKICRFKLVYSDVYPEIDRPQSTVEQLDHSARKKERRTSTITRVVRDSQLANTVKTIYNHQCQVCGTAIPTKNGFYSEGAHIKPLGIPHNGDDSLGNLLCLCPNHHVMLDKGAFSVRNDLSLVGAVDGFLTIHEGHKIDLENLNYHRSSHGYD